MKQELEHRIAVLAREYVISSTLFRHAIGQKLGLSVTDMECLGLLFHKSIASPSELARHTGLSSGATTAMLDRLESAELIVRQPNPNDRRGTHISINRKTAKRLAPYFISARENQQKIISGFTIQELETISSFFAQSNAMWEAEKVKLHERIRN